MNFRWKVWKFEKKSWLWQNKNYHFHLFAMGSSEPAQEGNLWICTGAHCSSQFATCDSLLAVSATTFNAKLARSTSKFRMRTGEFRRRVPKLWGREREMWQNHCDSSLTDRPAGALNNKKMKGMQRKRANELRAPGTFDLLIIGKHIAANGIRKLPAFGQVSGECWNFQLRSSAFRWKVFNGLSEGMLLSSERSSSWAGESSMEIHNSKFATWDCSSSLTELPTL